LTAIFCDFFLFEQGKHNFATMCGGFNCSKNTLIGLNIVYIFVAFLLIGVATAGKTSSYVTSLPIVGGIVASGVFLLFIAIIGLVGAVKHNQILLFFYMVVLFAIFLIQFSVACACLAVDTQEELDLASKAWVKADNDTKNDAQVAFKCCGFQSNANSTGDDFDGFKCDAINACGDGPVFNCPTCKEAVEDKINYAFNASGGVGLFFAFTEVSANFCDV
jgi:tetraspanin-13/31